MTMRRAVSDRPNWWQDFFSGLVLDFVRHSRDAEQTRAEADFLQETLGLPFESHVLDVPCGGGRLALELAARGYRITGVDFSDSLLESARRRGGELGLDIKWECRDMRDLPWPGKFDGAYCFWSSFGYFDEAGNLDFLQAVSRVLKPGAPFLMDTPLIETRLLEMAAQERVWWPVGDLLALEERSFDHVTSRVESDWTIIKDGRMEQKRLSLRLYTYHELCGLLERAGFGRFRAFGSLDWEPFELGSTWLYLLAAKVGEPV